MAEPAHSLIAELCDRIFGPGTWLHVARVAEGVSTYVFRVERPGDVFYLRVLPEQGASFAPEVLAHRLLAARGVRVPEVVFWEHYHAGLDRSVMVTTEIKGQAVGHDTDPVAVHDVLIAAGRDLARANAIPVRHFGWVGRDRPDVVELEGEVTSLRASLLADLHPHLELLLRHAVFGQRTIDRIAAIIAAPHVFDDEQAYLAHGDFDPTHIYHAHGVYTGIIDWGEIRGTQQLYDLAHFSMVNGSMLPSVLQGYREIASVPADFEQRLQLGSLCIAIGRLAGGLLKRPSQSPFPPYVAAVERAVVVLSR